MSVVALLTIVAGLLAFAATAQATTVVTLGFDDGLASQYAQRSVLSDHGVHATYFVNTNTLGGTRRMTWAQVRELADAGHEVGGHTLDHRALPALTTEEQRRQVCDDRAALLRAGYPALNFAYPNGATSTAVKTVVADCGYETARTTGGLDEPPDCCEYSETIPPRQAYSVRAVQPRLTTPLSYLTDTIDLARTSGGGWIDIVLHDLCTGTCTGFDSYSMNVTTLDGLLDWIDARPDVVVKSTAEALGRTGPPPDRTPPTVTLTAPANGATVTGAVPLTASASDDIGVDRVEFIVGGNVVGSDATAPFELTWDSSAAGASAAIAAKAYDRAGNWATSATSTVTVTHPSPPTTFVTLGFDDGLASQYAQRAILAEHGAPATFFLNSNTLGGTRRMTWAQVRELADAGHEIGGHTLDHRALPALTPEEQRRQVCDDRTALVNAGYAARNFAYPNGLTNASVKTVIAGCGYDTARTTGGLDELPDCCEYAERMPPKDPYSVRAVQPRSTTPLSYLTDTIDLARTSGGGWIDIVLHDLCTGTCTGFDSYSMNVTTLDGLLDWIDAHPEVVVKTTAQVLALGDRTLPAVSLTAPADRARVGPGNVTISARASDNVGLDRVEFVVGGTVVGTDTSSPYSVTWNSTGAASPATITARAVDRAGNARTSAAVSVTIG